MPTKSIQKDIPALKAWLLAMRPKTLTSAVIPIVAGSALAYSQGAAASWILALFALGSAFCIQIGTNLINDALDFKKGADTSDRIGPARVTQMGWLTMQQVFVGGLLFFLMAILLGIPLIIKGGSILILVLGASVLCGYLYTGGPFPLAYIGLGDLFVLLFFGFVSTMAVFYIQTGYVDLFSFLAGAQIGLLDTVLIAVNNLRDIHGDAKVKKMTLAVRFGVLFSRWEITLLILSSYALNVLWLFSGYWLAALLTSFTWPVAAILLMSIWRNEPGSIYNKYLGIAALLHFSFGVLLSFGFCLR